ncbi:MAG TPA: phosphatase PAP2 family protein [Nocardioides sp.]|nr:phosphatase PAP2 family protein [Nocardioides sp.]
MGRRLLHLVAAYAVIALVVVGWGWLLTHSLHGAIEPVDDDVSRWFAGERTSWLDPVSDVGTLMGETPVGLGVGAIVAVVAGVALRSLGAAALILVADAGDGGIYWLGTTADPRDRPPVHIMDPGLVPDASFPSGHVGTAVAVYGGAALLLTIWMRSRGRPSRIGRVVVVILACLPLFVATSRLYQGAHHLTDVGTSLVYGVVLLAVLSAALPLRSKPSETPMPRSVRGHTDAPVPHR